MNLFYDILDQKRLDILPLFAAFKDKFYLAGGTGLALQLGHRDSIDFDFFTPDHFDTYSFYSELADIFKTKKIVKTLDEKDSLNITVDEEIRLSFLRYPYALVNAPIEENSMKIASVEDIGCMKLSAIVSRAAWKDYVDAYFILRKISLGSLLEVASRKMADLDRNLILKSLVYFADIAQDPIIFKRGSDVSKSEVENFLNEQVKALARP